jgi:hypothetical protein
MTGEYKEKLPFGTGDLIATKSTYYIQFYFSGPDMRYSGTLLQIHSNEINKYIKAYEQNWNKFEELKAMKNKLGNEFSVSGVLNMPISIGGWKNGICIDSYHMPLSTKKEIDKLIQSFEWAKEKGPEIMKFLKSL